MIIGITGKSASGKSTVAKLLSRVQNVRLITSYTTRPKRPNEVDGSDYHFTAKEDFWNRRMILVNYIEDNDWYYGTSELEIKEALEKGEDVIIVVDAWGADNLQKQFKKDAYIIELETDGKTRLLRSLQRDTDTFEICRRFVKDEEDWKKVSLEPQLKIDTTNLRVGDVVLEIQNKLFAKY